MNLSLRSPALASIAVLSGAIVLLGYFIQIPFLTNLGNIFLNWALILAAIALAIGGWNLLRVHYSKFHNHHQDGIYSLILMISFVLSFLIVMFFGLTSKISVWLLDYILVPVESSLVAVLAVILIYALVRMFYRGFSFFNFLFAGTAFLMLLINAVLSWAQIPIIGELRDWISQVWSLAGARAILIGIALGAIATGLRVLIGADRPYEG